MKFSLEISEGIKAYLLEVYRLLDEYRPHVGCESKMIELLNAIESLS